MKRNNQGRQNHCRFKTRYWQQQHQPAQPIHSLLTTKPLPIPFLRIRPTSPKVAPKAPNSPRLHHNEMLSHRQYKTKLKMHLQTLKNDHFDTINVSEDMSRDPYVKSSHEGRQYRGKSVLERYRRNRQRRTGSVTLQVRPGSEEYRMQQRMSIVQQRQPWQFMSHTSSSRYRASFSPLY